MPLFSRIPFDKNKIEIAIQRLEKQSSAELRVYIERHKPADLQAFDRGLQIFYALNMQHTQSNNGVLIYIAYKDQQCAIVGDEGIHRYVGEQFWQEQYQIMANYFKQGHYTEGVLAVIENISLELTAHFPISADDRNELDNEVIIHE